MKLFDYQFLHFDEEAEQDVVTGTEKDKVQDEVKDKASELKYSDADLDKIIEQKFAKWQKQTQKKVDEAKRLAEMSAQERAEHERDVLQQELDALKKANTRSEMEKTARSLLLADGISVSDDVVAQLIHDDAETTSNAVKQFSTNFKSAVQAEVKKQLSHPTPSTGGTGVITKAEILAIKDRAKRQQAIRDNLDLFK